MEIKLTIFYITLALRNNWLFRRDLPPATPGDSRGKLFPFPNQFIFSVQQLDEMAELPYLEPDKLLFSPFDDKLILKVSVKCITNPTSVDRIGNPLPGRSTRPEMVRAFTDCQFLSLPS